MDDEEIKIRRMTKKEFALRFVLWVALALIVPLVYIGVAYGIFSAPSEARRLSGWGIIALIFSCGCLIYIVSQARKALPLGSFVRQCIDGAIGLIPLFGAIMLLEVIKDNIADFQRFLIVMLICEAIAVPVNPMPKWAMQHNVDLAKYSMFYAFSRALSKQPAKQ